MQRTQTTHTHHREVPEIEEEDRAMVTLRAEEAAMLMRQLRAVKDNVAGLREMIESRGSGQVCVSVTEHRHAPSA